MGYDPSCIVFVDDDGDACASLYSKMRMTSDCDFMVINMDVTQYVKLCSEKYDVVLLLKSIGQI